ncbi:MAG: 1-acyl-sn-glycerol-3-phosphate acyltransferase [Acidobacteria bacterium]|nr:1-acyl-sn-glycerol-3-phosphate acyltransferase [Acidobacteriota bacterium]
MLRSLLLVLPSTLILALVGFAVMIPVTWILRDVRPLYAVARMVVRVILRLAGVRIDVRGPDPWLAPQPCIYVANHTSNVDPPAVFPYLPRVVIMGKAVVFRWPLLGHALKLAEFIPVERNEPESRRQALEAGVQRLRKGLSLLIFPEGTRSPDGRLLPFRPGPFTMALETHVPIVPITVIGTRDIMSKGKLGIRPGRVRLVFHPPISTAGLTPADRDTLMQQVRDAIGSAL